jgi:nucleotide-binding universal stress UspA family protein
MPGIRIGGRNERTRNARGLQSILCPGDFDTPSARALDLAATLAQQNHALLHILHVVFVSASSRGYPAEPYDRLGKVELANLEKFVRTRVPPSISCDSIVRIGNPADAIVAAAKDLGADLIVMATNGRKGIPRAILGSVAEGVTRISKQPVLLLKPQTQVPRSPSESHP